MAIVACEDFDPTLVANASVNISGGGGSQFISNIHLSAYSSTSDFHDTLYPAYRDQLFASAKAFLSKTKASPAETLILVSAGFDACEHEFPEMSRHGAKVPTGFFERFARDAVLLAKAVAEERLVAILEGGYSPRALYTGAGSFSELFAMRLPTGY